MPTAANVLVPWQETLRISPYHTIRRIQIVLKPEEAHLMSGKFDDPDRRLALSKPQLESLGRALGFKDISSRRVEEHHEEIYHWEYVGQATGIDGQPEPVKKDYSLDMRLADRDGKDGGYILKLRNDARNKMRKALEKPEWYHKFGMPPVKPQQDKKEEWVRQWEEWIERTAMDEWYNTYRHVTARAQTGAYLRAIRSFCQIKSTYSAKEFDNPWLVFRIEFDAARAIEAGGRGGQLAEAAIAASLTQSLGLSSENIKLMLDALPKQDEKQLPPPDPDLFNASDETIEELEQVMEEAGFKNRAWRDKRAIDLFGVPLSQLTNRHVRLLTEYVQYGQLAVAHLSEEERPEFMQHLQDVARLAYAEGDTVEKWMEMSWWEKIHPAEEEEAEGAEDTEEAKTEEAQEAETINGEAEYTEEEDGGESTEADKDVADE